MGGGTEESLIRPGRLRPEIQILTIVDRIGNGTPFSYHSTGTVFFVESVRVILKGPF